MKKRIMEKNRLFIILSALLIIAFIAFVMAAINTITINTPGNNTNTSDTTPDFNFTAVSNSSVNNFSCELFINNTPYGINTNVSNDTATVITANATLTDATYTWNINCTDSTNTTSIISTLTVDATAPNVTFVTPAAAANAYYDSSSGIITLNVTVTDDTMSVGTVIFNLTNSSGDQNLTYPTNKSGTAYINATLNVSALADGKYNLTVWANDTLGNLNNATYIQLTVDNAAPSTITIASSSATKTSLTLTITATDALSGINKTCAVDSSEATISGTGATQTITHSNLLCGTSYSYTATCEDRVGNSNSSAATSFSTSACSSGGSGPATTPTTSSWTMTYSVTDTQFSEGYSKELSAKNRMKVKVGNEDHYVGVLELTETSAKIEVSSVPVEVNLGVGDDAKLDVKDDGFYDIYVKLNGIADNKADVLVQSIHEEIPEGEGAVSTSGEVAGEEPEAEEPPAKEGISIWVWIVIGIIVVLIIVGIAIKKKQ